MTPKEWVEIRVVLDGPPSHVSGRFVECEDENGRSFNAGDWHKRDDGLWELQIKLNDTLQAARLEMREECAKVADAHKGAAARARRERHPKLLRDASPDAITEIEAEERGEDIASSVIATAIRALPIERKEAPPVQAASPTPDARPEDLDPDWLADVLGHTPMSDGTRLADRLDRVSLVNVALEITEGGALGGGRLHRRDEAKATTEEGKS